MYDLVLLLIYEGNFDYRASIDLLLNTSCLHSIHQSESANWEEVKHAGEIPKQLSRASTPQEPVKHSVPLNLTKRGCTNAYSETKHNIYTTHQRSIAPIKHAQRHAVNVWQGAHNLQRTSLPGWIRAKRLHGCPWTLCGCWRGQSQSGTPWFGWEPCRLFPGPTGKVTALRKLWPGCWCLRSRASAKLQMLITGPVTHNKVWEPLLAQIHCHQMSSTWLLPSISVLFAQ